MHHWCCRDGVGGISCTLRSDPAWGCRCEKGQWGARCRNLSLLLHPNCTGAPRTDFVIIWMVEMEMLFRETGRAPDSIKDRANPPGFTQHQVWAKQSLHVKGPAVPISCAAIWAAGVPRSFLHQCHCSEPFRDGSLERCVCIICLCDFNLFWYDCALLGRANPSLLAVLWAIFTLSALWIASFSPSLFSGVFYWH